MLLGVVMFCADNQDLAGSTEDFRFIYYHTARTHLALDKQCPEPRSVELPVHGTIIAFPHIGGLHHEYRRAA